MLFSKVNVYAARRPNLEEDVVHLNEALENLVSAERLDLFHENIAIIRTRIAMQMVKLVVSDLKNAPDHGITVHLLLDAYDALSNSGLKVSRMAAEARASIEAALERLVGDDR